MAATQEQIRDLAATIATQAQAIADGTITGPQWANVKRVKENAETLFAWTPDDRSGARAYIMAPDAEVD